MGQRSATRELTERWETAGATAKLSHPQDLLHPQDVLLIAVLPYGGSRSIENKPRRAIIINPSWATLHPAGLPNHASSAAMQAAFSFMPIIGGSFIAPERPSTGNRH